MTTSAQRSRKRAAAEVPEAQLAARGRQHTRGERGGATYDTVGTAAGDERERTRAPGGDPAGSGRVAAGKVTSAARRGRLECRTVGRFALAGAGQARGVVVGVEIWHVRGATLQAQTRPRSAEAEPSERPSTVCGGSATLSDLLLRNKFVT